MNRLVHLGIVKNNRGKHCVVGAVLLLSSIAAQAAETSIQNYWISDPVDPGQTVLMIGNNLPVKPLISVIRIGDEKYGSFGSSIVSKVEDVSAIQPEEGSVKFVLPDTLKRGLFKFRVSGSSESAEFYLNRPVIWWFLGNQGTYATAGGWVRVFGKNLLGPGRSTKLQLIDSSTKKLWLIKATSSSQWDAYILLPAEIPAGTYSLRLNNGWGAELGWSTPLEMVIQRPVALTRQQVFDVHAYGAIGNGRDDDTRAVLAALAAAKAARGGVVLLRRGRFRLTASIEIPPGVTLRGSGRDLTAIHWDDFDVPPKSLVNGTSDFAIEDMAIYASNYIHLITSDLPKSGFGGGNIRLERLVIRASRYRGHLNEEQVDARFHASLKADPDSGDAIALGGENLLINNCDVYSSGRSLFLFRPRASLIHDNKFYNGRWGWYSISGADGVVFEDNEIIGADLMASGGGINNLRGNRVSQNVWFARNKLSLFFGWDREAMTSDASGGFYYGRIQYARGNEIRLADSLTLPPKTATAWSGAAVFILGGKGAGQYRQIVDVNEDRVRINVPWAVSPDESSIITITSLQRHYHFIDNQFSDAGVAIQFYGTSIEHIIAGNRAVRAGPIYNSGRWYRHYQPSWFNMFLANELVDGNIYRGGPNNAIYSGEAFIGALGLQKAPNKFPLSVGNLIRGNRLRSNAHIEISGIDINSPGVKDIVIENNIVEKASVGLKIDAGVRGLVARQNIFRDVVTTIEDASPISAGNLIER